MIDDTLFAEIENEEPDATESVVTTCGHPGCACLMQEEERFCSDECETASADLSECSCGHRACAEDTSGVHA